MDRFGPLEEFDEPLEDDLSTYLPAAGVTVRAGLVEGAESKPALLLTFAVADEADVRIALVGPADHLGDFAILIAQVADLAGRKATELGR